MATWKIQDWRDPAKQPRSQDFLGVLSGTTSAKPWVKCLMILKWNYQHSNMWFIVTKQEIMNTSTYTPTTSEHLITDSVVNSTTNNASRWKTHSRISYYDNDFAQHKMTLIAKVFCLFYLDDGFSAVLKKIFFSLRYVIFTWSKLCEKKHMLKLILARCALDVIITREKFVESSMITGTLFAKNWDAANLYQVIKYS